MAEPNKELGLQDALALHRKGNISEAAAIYGQILTRHPDNAAALHLLGVAELQSGNASAAVELIRRAISIESRNAGWHSNLGLALSQAGRLEEALRSLDHALKLAPGTADTLNHRGNVLRSLGRPGEALAAYARALATNPRHADALNNRGAALVDLNRVDEALASFDAALAADPNHAGALANRGALCVRQKRFDAALGDLNRAIELDPRNAAALNSRGNALSGLQLHTEALVDFDRAIAADPAYADGWLNCAVILERLRRFEEALGACDQALMLNPAQVDVLVFRGKLLRQSDRVPEALDSYNRALQIAPANADALISRANLLSALGKLDQAFTDYERAFSSDPEHELLAGWRIFSKLRMCDWRGIAGEILAIEEAVERGLRVCSPAVMLAISDKKDTLHCAENYARHYFPGNAQQPGISHRSSGGKIRVGYFSGDFHEHATTWLTAGFFEHQDRTRFETTAFSFGPPSRDSMRLRLERTFDRFLDVRGHSDADVVAAAREHGIDIAIDMKGFTEGSRTGIFASRAAPVQVSWLGYCSTMGTDYIDYLIADTTVLPQQAQSSYREKIIWMPDSYYPTDGSQPMAKIPDRKQCGLPRDGFVFCCFNNNHKIMPAVFDVWMRLLNQVQGSVLWLFRDNPFAAKNLRAEAGFRRIDPQRLVFADRLSQPEHLARHVLADLFLDTLPYNAHTTASDALWAGLPVLTCPGDSFQGRVAASLLRAVGLPEMIAPSLEAYEAIALDLARTPEMLQNLKQKLRAQQESCRLFDTARYTRNFETALSAIWERYCSGQPPESFHVEPHPL